MHATLATKAVKVLTYELSDIARSGWIMAYAAFFFVVTDVLFRFSGSSVQVLISLLNVALLLVPLVSAVFGTMYLYSAREFIELMLAQPIRRSSLFAGLYAGLALPLSLAFIIGTGLPFLWHGIDAPGQGVVLAKLLLVGALLTLIFTALAFLVATRVSDRVKGLALAVLFWLFFAIIYDGLVLITVQAFAEYPLERPMIALMLLNPVDLARVLLLLELDVSALMGYTGAAFEQFLGSAAGSTLALAALAVWLVGPLAFARRGFVRKDF